MVHPVCSGRIPAPDRFGHRDLEPGNEGEQRGTNGQSLEIGETDEAGDTRPGEHQAAGLSVGVNDEIENTGVRPDQVFLGQGQHMVAHLTIGGWGFEEVGCIEEAYHAFLSGGEIEDGKVVVALGIAFKDESDGLIGLAGHQLRTGSSDQLNGQPRMDSLEDAARR